MHAQAGLTALAVSAVLLGECSVDDWERPGGDAVASLRGHPASAPPTSLDGADDEVGRAEGTAPGRGRRERAVRPVSVLSQPNSGTGVTGCAWAPSGADAGVHVVRRDHQSHHYRKGEESYTIGVSTPPGAATFRWCWRALHRPGDLRRGQG
jgi:hypothetical protein